ncbi:MAG: hypothetical protein AAB443_00800 [Patescibacteria group bacterium]
MTLALLDLSSSDVTVGVYKYLFYQDILVLQKTFTFKFPLNDKYESVLVPLLKVIQDAHLDRVFVYSTDGFGLNLVDKLDLGKVTIISSFSIEVNASYPFCDQMALVAVTLLRK